MKSVDHALDRLFRAAARGGEPDAADAAAVMPAALQSRILAAQREWTSRRASDEFGPILALIRRGLAAAALVAVVTAVVCHRLDDGLIPPVESLVVESVAELSLLPDRASP